mmetsp:Transcript_801/g.1819  ORF Transcript_801/g.1819 Transcript_801/m.1819 type:complete len:94 (-) Transcript_801:76-357(-)
MFGNLLRNKSNPHLLEAVKNAKYINDEERAGAIFRFNGSRFDASRAEVFDVPMDSFFKRIFSSEPNCDNLNEFERRLRKIHLETCPAKTGRAC